MVSFEMEGGLPLALARGVFVAGLLSVFGTLAFRVAVAPRACARMPPEMAARVEHSLLRLTQLGIAVTGLSALLWLAAQAADMAGAASAAELAAALPVVAWDTTFGHLVLLQEATLLAAFAAGLRGPAHVRWPLGLAGAALALQAGHGHSASMQGGSAVLVACDVVHLLGAGAWLGGLLPLLLLTRMAPVRAAAVAARWFSPLGKLAVVALAISASVQGWVLVGSIPGLVGTAYGWMVLVKLSLSAVLLGFAAANRYRFAPALLGHEPAAARRVLLRSLAVQTGFGVAIVIAASMLSELPPAMHVQPAWPFPVRFTLDTVREDPEFRNEVLGAVLALAAAAVLLAVAVALHRPARWLALAAAAALAWFAVPHLDLLFVPASPTSYYRSPTGFAAASIVEGAALYPDRCAGCHGQDGRGHGPATDHTAMPADLTAVHLWAHRDGEIFWWLSHGIEAPQGGMAMPGFADTLSEDQRWDLIDYIRARNAGLAARDAGDWSLPMPAPGLQATCASGRTVAMSDLHGKAVRVVIGGDGDVRASPDVTTILVGDPAAQPGPGLCIAGDEAVAQAYGIVSGLRPQELAGAQFLVDGDGWLRAVQRGGPTQGRADRNGTGQGMTDRSGLSPGSMPQGWDDAATLAARLRQLRTHPIVAGAGSDHAGMRM